MFKNIFSHKSLQPHLLLSIIFLCGLLNSQTIDLKELESLDLKNDSMFTQESNKVSDEDKSIDNLTIVRDNEKLEQLSKEKFGYSFFLTSPTSISATSDLPLPNDYIISVGDELKIIKSGIDPEVINLLVGYDGSILVPEVGSLNIAGEPLFEVKKIIKNLFSASYVGAEVDVAISSLKAKKISVVGAVNSAGTFLVNPFSTVSNALAYSSGLTNYSSLRKIEVISTTSSNKSTFDLYDLLIYGDRSNDKNISAGDTIKVGGTDNFVEIEGEVLRPMTYEYLSTDTFGDLLNFSLGPTSDANVPETFVIFETNGKTEIEKVSLTDYVADRKITRLVVPKKSKSTDLQIQVRGSSINESVYEKSKFFELEALINEISFSDNIYPFFFILKQFDQATFSREIIAASLSDRDTYSNVKLKNSPELTFFSYEDFLDFQKIVDYLDLSGDRNLENISDLRKREKLIIGSIASLSAPDDSYLNNLDEDSNISTQEERQQSLNQDLNDMIGNKEDLISLLEYELAEVQKDIYRALNAFGGNDFPKESRIFREKDLTEYLLDNSVNLLLGDKKYNFPLTGKVAPISLFNYVEKDSNKINKSSVAVVGSGNGQNLDNDPYQPIRIESGGIVSFSSLDVEKIQVEISGQVKTPGIYFVHPDATLQDLYDISGGVLENAEKSGVVFSRKSVIEQEKQTVKNSRQILLDAIIASISNPIVSGQRTINYGSIIQLLLFAEDLDFQGRITGNLSDGSSNSAKLVLEEGDKIIVPSKSNLISIRGEVNTPQTIVYSSNLKLKNYIDSAGGLSSYADKNGIYLLKRDGTTVQLERGYFGQSSSIIEPGDSIIVPRDVEKVSLIPSISIAASVLSDIAFAAASLKAISN